MARKNKEEYYYGEDDGYGDVPKSKTAIKTAIIGLLGTIVTVIGTIIVMQIDKAKIFDDGVRDAERRLIPTIATLNDEIGLLETQLTQVTTMPLTTEAAQVQSNSGKIKGLLTDRSGSPLSNMTISIANGSENKNRFFRSICFGKYSSWISANSSASPDT